MTLSSIKLSHIRNKPIFLLPLFFLYFLYFPILSESANKYYLDKEGILECNPSTKHLFGRFFLQRYFDARDELGMENLRVKQKRNPSEFAEIAEYVLLKFFSWTGGTLVYYRRDMDPIIYARIWKCANEGIGMNLHTMISGQGTALSKALVHEAKTLESLQATLHTMHRKEFLNSSAMKVFTFVREPFSKFISGFTESVFRTGPNLSLRRPTMPPMVLNYTNAKFIIERVFDRKTPIIQMDHFFPLSGALFEFPLRAVGHLERFKEEWDTIIRPLYGITEEYNLRHGLHPTSEIHPRNKKNKNSSSNDMSISAAGEPNSVRSVLRLLFAKELKYKRAICHLLLIDYVCLPEYPLPIDCQFLNNTMHRAREALHQKREIPVS